jgi:carbamoyl-phosphate synthase small subunit
LEQKNSQILYLVLENGRVFRGEPFGAEGEVMCEMVFATGMTGYMETLTDKSYAGYGVIQTFPLIGNYGVNLADMEADKPYVSAYIVRECCDTPSNFRSRDNLDSWLKSYGVVGIKGVDTRSLTRLIRERGVMNGMITKNPESCDLEALRAYSVPKDVVPSVSVKTIEYHPGKEGGPTVVILDCGYKRSILECFLERGCSVYIVPALTSVKDITAYSPDGVLVSNGPGDPQNNPTIIETVRELLGTGLPIFGICLGHQIVALAHGFKTTKMKYGHRGENQPVRRHTDGRVFITSQNHGYTVISESIDPKKAKLLYSNVNDGGCEGIEYKENGSFSVQFHPEAGAGPHDTRFIFDEFILRMRNRRAGDF